MKKTIIYILGMVELVDTCSVDNNKEVAPLVGMAWTPAIEWACPHEHVAETHYSKRIPTADFVMSGSGAFQQQASGFNWT